MAAEAQVRAARAGVQTAKAAGLPTLKLAVNAGRTGFLDEERVTSNSYSIAVNLRIPLFTGFRDTYSVRLAEAQTEKPKRREIDCIARAGWRSGRPTRFEYRPDRNRY